MPPKEPPVAAKPVATPRRWEKKWAMAPTAGVKMREVPTPPRMEKVRMKCQYSGICGQFGTASHGWKKLTGTLTDPNRSHNQTDGASKHQPSWSFGVEYRPDLQAAAKGQENIDTEDPAYRTGWFVGQLMCAEISLEGADGVHKPEGCQHAGEGSENDKPCPQTAFRIGHLRRCVRVRGFGLGGDARYVILLLRRCACIGAANELSLWVIVGSTSVVQLLQLLCIMGLFETEIGSFKVGFPSQSVVAHQPWRPSKDKFGLSRQYVFSAIGSCSSASCEDAPSAPAIEAWSVCEEYIMVG